MTALMMASMECHAAVVSLLIEHGAEVDLQSDVSGKVESRSIGTYMILARYCRLGGRR